jgi:hypothetical protein
MLVKQAKINNKKLLSGNFIKAFLLGWLLFSFGELLFFQATKLSLDFFATINLITTITTIISCYFLNMANFLFCEKFTLVKAYNPRVKARKLLSKNARS